MRPITTADLTGLLKPRKGPCVSIYQPTRRSYPESQQGPILYKNLLRRAEELLRQRHPGGQVQAALDKFHAFDDDPYFWANQLDGLAVLGSPDAFHVFELQRPVPERVVVADSFHLKPLLRITQSADRFQVLCLKRDEARLWVGNRDALDEIHVDGVPATAWEALGEDARAARKEQIPGGGPRGSESGAKAQGTPAKVEAEQFFLKLDKAVTERVSNRSMLPLVLAALPENQAMFRGLSHNPHLAAEGIDRNPDGLSADELRRMAWKCVEPRYLERLNRFCEDFRTARSRGQGSDDVAEVAAAAHVGRVGILLVEAERFIPGSLNPDTGMPRAADPASGIAEDVLDDIGEVALRTDAAVVVVPRERMPSGTGLAAVFRY